MGQPVYILRESMPYGEFLEWGAYFELDRASYSQTDVNIAQLALCVQNYLYKSKIDISDVLPSLKKRKPQTQNQISGKLKALAKIINR